MTRQDHRHQTHGTTPVAVLGATGTVGQRIIQLLEGHPWFHVAAVAASPRSVGKPYAEACHWALSTPIPEDVAHLVVRSLDPDTWDGDRLPLVFSALPADIAREIEPKLAQAGMAVSSNASAFRLEPDVPVLLPDVNPDHLALLEVQQRIRTWNGLLITNPNCTTSGIALVLKPLQEAFGLRSVIATSMQAISGAGYPGIPSLDILANTVPWIPGEEEKIEHESSLLLGRIQDEQQTPASFRVSAHANRVPVVDGHTVCLSIGFERESVLSKDVASVLAAFPGVGSASGLPSAPSPPIRVLAAPDRPQPRLDSHAQAGMQVSVGRIRPCSILDIRLVLVVHNTIRGAAGGAILNAELLMDRGWIQ